MELRKELIMGVEQNNEYIFACDIAKEQPDNSLFMAVPIQIGTKIEVKEDILHQLQSNIYIQENFKLNIRRLNRWWYSVYFAKRI